jgi:Uma2 family endonuclease
MLQEVIVTVTAPPISPPAAGEGAVPTEPIYRLSVQQYRAMAQHGILHEDDPVELLEGWLVQKMTKRPPHSIATGLVRDALDRVLPDGWHTDVQEPISTAESEPEPDVAIIRGARRDYLEAPPAHPNIALVVEVAESSLRQDRETKKRIYARAGLPTYWIVNLIGRHVEVYTSPSGPAPGPDYGQRQEYGLADTLPVILDGIEVARIAVRELLP